MERIRIRGLAEGREALARARAAGRRAVVAGPAVGGVGWFGEVAAILSAEYPDTLGQAVFDCGSDASAVFEGLRAGLNDLAYDGPRREALAALATRVGATLHDPGDLP